jgi:hypothetical protein
MYWLCYVSADIRDCVSCVDGGVLIGWSSGMWWIDCVMYQLIHGIVFSCVLFWNKLLVLVVMFGYKVVCVVIIVRFCWYVLIRWWCYWWGHIVFVVSDRQSTELVSKQRVLLYQQSLLRFVEYFYYFNLLYNTQFYPQHVSQPNHTVHVYTAVILPIFKLSI